jgi:hypothetical protein
MKFVLFKSASYKKQSFVQKRAWIGQGRWKRALLRWQDMLGLTAEFAMRGVAIVGISLLLLAGCASDDTAVPDDSAQQGAKDDAICRSYQTYPGTTPYVQCRLALRRQAQHPDDDGPTLINDLFGS